MHDPATAMKSRNYKPAECQVSDNSDDTLFQLPFRVWLLIWTILDEVSLLTLMQTTKVFYDNLLLRELILYKQFIRQAQAKLKQIVISQKMRFQSLIRDFSSIDRNDAKNTYSLMDYPIRESLDSPQLTSILLDHGRANSFIIGQAYNCALFRDPYYRDASAIINTFALVKMPTEFQTLNKDYQYVPYTLELTALTRLLLSKKAYIRTKDDCTCRNYTSIHLNYNELIATAKIDRTLLKKNKSISLDKILATLGHLGALRPRDWQLLAAVDMYDNLSLLEQSYLYLLYLTGFQSEQLQICPVRLSDNSFTTKKHKLLSHLDNLHRTFSTDVMAEQRAYYCQFLMKLLQQCAVSEDASHNEYIQVLFTLDRLENLIAEFNDSVYVIFLRLLEACIDEILVLLALKSQHETFSAGNIHKVASEFVEKSIGQAPTCVDLTTSCMQGLWLCFQLGINFFITDYQRYPVNYLIDTTCYFEIFLVLKSLFDINLMNKTDYVSLSLAPPDFLKCDLPYEQNNIYDVYISNFESNVAAGRKGMVCTDIYSVVANQMLLRSKKNIKSPLLLIVDYTMCNFDALYLKKLLKQFKQEITIGLLGVLVCHSGNKYLHLGTDKVLASLMYGYFQPEHFPLIHKYFEHQLGNNKIGDFFNHSPSILLTVAYMEHAHAEILAFPKMIRKRTLFIYEQAIPEALKQTGFFTIDNPVYKGSIMNANCGFITIRADHSLIGNEDIYSSVVYLLWDLLHEIGICTRDGFGFNQTTKVEITNSVRKIVRINIGTENVNEIILKLQWICEFLLITNAIINKHRIDLTNISTNLPYTHLYNELERATNRFMVSSNTGFSAVLGNNSQFHLKFFNQTVSARNLSSQLINSDAPSFHSSSILM